MSHVLDISTRSHYNTLIHNTSRLDAMYDDYDLDAHDLDYAYDLDEDTYADHYDLDEEYARDSHDMQELAYRHYAC